MALDPAAFGAAPLGVPPEVFFYLGLAITVVIFVKEYLALVTAMSSQFPKVLLVGFAVGSLVIAYLMWRLSYYTAIAMQNSPENVTQLIRSSLVLGGAVTLLGPFIVLVPRKSHLVTNRVGKVLVDIAHHRWTRYITFCLYATVIVANIICIYSIYVLFTDIMGLSVTDALGVALLYGFLNIVYVASFYATMFRHPIVIRGTDLFKTLRSSLYTDKPISREEVFELPERTRRRVIQSDDGTFVLRAYWLHSWQFLYAYICVFSALMLVTIGTAVWYFIVDMNNFKSLNESSAAFALSILFFVLTIASVITCFIFLLNEAFHTRERLDDEQEGAAMWKTPQPEENSLRKLQNEEPRSMAAPEEELSRTIVEIEPESDAIEMDARPGCVLVEDVERRESLADDIAQPGSALQQDQDFNFHSVSKLDVHDPPAFRELLPVHDEVVLEIEEKKGKKKGKKMDKKKNKEEARGDADRSDGKQRRGGDQARRKNTKDAFGPGPSRERSSEYDMPEAGLVGGRHDIPASSSSSSRNYLVDDDDGLGEPTSLPPMPSAPASAPAGPPPPPLSKSGHTLNMSPGGGGVGPPARSSSSAAARVAPGRDHFSYASHDDNVDDEEDYSDSLVEGDEKEEGGIGGERESSPRKMQTHKSTRLHVYKLTLVCVRRDGTRRTPVSCNFEEDLSMNDILELIRAQLGLGATESIAALKDTDGNVIESSRAFYACVDFVFVHLA